MISRRAVFVVIGVAVVLAVSLARWYTSLSQSPLYTPGRVRAMAFDSNSDARAEASTWQLEEGVTVKVHRAGQGRRVLIVHGGPAVPFSELPNGFKSFASQSQYEVITWDQRGCGGSSRPVEKVDAKRFFTAAAKLEAEVGLTAQVADIERIRRILGEEQLILVGHSFGALLASLYASEFPQRVKALVFVAPADVLVLPSRHGGLFLQIRARLPEGKRAGFESYLRRSFQLDSLFEKTESQLTAFNAGLAEYYAVAAKAAHFEVPPVDPSAVGGFAVQAAYVGLGARHDWRPLMQEVTAPVLVMHGAKDLTPEIASRDFASAFPHAKFELLKGSGHFPFVDAPDDFARVLGAFLAGL